MHGVQPSRLLTPSAVAARITQAGQKPELQVFSLGGAMNELTNQRRSIGPGVFGAIAVGLVIIGALVWLLFRGGNRADQPPAPPAVTALVTAPEAVTEFENSVRDKRAEQEMAKDHAFTSNGLRKLAAALESLCDRDGVRSAEIGQQLAQIRKHADSIQADPHDTSHAESIRAAFNTAADLMTTLQQRHYPGLATQVAQVRRAAEAIDPAQLTLAQKAEVGAFFAQASELLRTMAQTEK
jgi:hypothetical protein